MRRLVKKLKLHILQDGVLKTLLLVFWPPYRRVLRRQKREKYIQMLQRESVEARFSEIYRIGAWGSRESCSGVGSEVAYTETLRSWMLDAIPRLNIQTFVDAPCGDMNWMKEVLSRVDVDYLGVDIVPEIIRSNDEHFGSDKISFKVGNICEDRLPDCDLLMVRDCLFHLSYADIDKFLSNIANMNFRFLLTTTHEVTVGFQNKDIITGDFRRIDLFSPPFNFRKDSVLESINDYPPDYPIKRRMILVAKDSVPTAISLAVGAEVVSAIADKSALGKPD